MSIEHRAPREVEEVASRVCGRGPRDREGLKQESKEAEKRVSGIPYCRRPGRANKMAIAILVALIA